MTFYIELHSFVLGLLSIQWHGNCATHFMIILSTDIDELYSSGVCKYNVPSSSLSSLFYCNDGDENL